MLVVPKAHYKNLFYVPEELAARTFSVAKRIMPGLRKATGCRAVNIFSPNGADGGQDVFLHSSVLQRAGKQDVQQGEKVALDVRDGQRGRQAVTIK